MNDIQFDVGLHGVPLFPVLAGYGTGIFVKMGMPVIVALVIGLIVLEIALKNSCRKNLSRPFFSTFTFTSRLLLQCASSTATKQ